MPVTFLADETRGTNGAGAFEDDGADAVPIACYWPFADWSKARGGREYRGVRSRQYTYVRALDGPWLLFDNRNDPYQMDNLIGRPSHRAVQERLEARLRHWLAAMGDEFLPGTEYMRRFGYPMGRQGEIPYGN